MRLLAIAGALTAVLALAPITQAQEQPPRFVVSGVVVKPDGSALAWLQEPTFIKGVMLVRPGDGVGPYKVTGITEDRVELQGPAGKVIVRLYATATGGPVPAAPKPVTPSAPTVVGGTPAPAVQPAPGTMPGAPGAASAPSSASLPAADQTEDKRQPGAPAMGGRHGSEPLVSNSPLIGTPLFPAAGEATAQEKAAAAARARVPIGQGGFGFGGQGSGSQPPK